MHTAPPRWLFIAAVVLLTRCTVAFENIPPELSVTCVTSEMCPNNLVCVNGTCRDLDDPCIERVGDSGKPVADLNICTQADGGNGICWRGACITSRCGDGIVNPVAMSDSVPAEECDDGAANNDSVRGGCRTTCLRAHCGDGVIDAGEQCDDGAANSNTTANVCRTDCVLPACGDGAVDDGEACDDGNILANDGCAADCASDESCGNAIVDAVRGEQCDDGPANSSAPNAICRPDCKYFHCGDGVADASAGEDCDGADLSGVPGATCLTYGYYYPQGLRCGPVCSFDKGGCSGFCGDSIVNGGELCDGAPPVGQSCLTYGFDTGALACSNACSPNFAGCQKFSWGRISSGTLATLYGVWGSAPDDVYIVGGDALLHYDGVQWTAIPTGGNVALQGVWGSGPTDVFVTAYGGVLHYDGTAWTFAAIAEGVSLLSIHGRAADDVYTVGRGGRMFHYNGTAWSDISQPALTTQDLWGVWVSPAGDVVYATGGQVPPVLLRRAGGAWSAVTNAGLSSSSSMYGVWGTSANDVYAVGWGYRKRFNGSTWSDVTVPGYATITGHHAMFGRSGKMLIASGGGSVLRYDGSWSELQDPVFTSQEFYGTWIDQAGGAYVVGSGGTILYRAPGNVTWESEDFNDTVNGNAAERSWGTSATSVFTVGGYGVVKRLSAGTWTETDTPACTLYDVWGTSTNNVFAVGCNGDIFRFNGTGWVEMTSPTSENLFAIWGSSGTDIYAGGYNRAFLRFNGTTWSTVNAGAALADDVHGIWGTGPNDIFVVGRTGMVMRYNGSTWTNITPPYEVGTQRWLRAVWGTSGSNVWAVGFEGTILHYNGTQWTRETDGNLTTEHLFTIYGTSANDIFAAGDGGTVIHYDGTSWQPFKSPATGTIKGIWATGSTYFFSGANGIYKLQWNRN